VFVLFPDCCINVFTLMCFLAVRWAFGWPCTFTFFANWVDGLGRRSDYNWFCGFNFPPIVIWGLVFRCDVILFWSLGLFFNGFNQSTL